jgi:DNA-binding transcriptional LysR family regulator
VFRQGGTASNADAGGIDAGRAWFPYAAAVNLQQLRYVVATAEHGTMTGAARACAVGQPALTRAVRALERELGLMLFERQGRCVGLTGDGREIVAVARRALAEIDAIEAYARRAGSDVVAGAVLTIAATPTVQSDLGSGLVSDFWVQYPQFPIRFVGCESPEAVGDAVTTGRADVGICDLPASPGLVELAYETREVVLVAPPGSALPDPFPVERLGELAFVLPAAGSVRRAALESFFRALGHRPKVAFETDERAAWIPAVLAGLGCCIWWRFQGGPALELGAQVLAFDPPMHREIAVVHRGGPPTPPVAGLLRLAARRRDAPVAPAVPWAERL